MRNKIVLLVVVVLSAAFGRAVEQNFDQGVDVKATLNQVGKKLGPNVQTFEQARKAAANLGRFMNQAFMTARQPFNVSNPTVDSIRQAYEKAFGPRVNITRDASGGAIYNGKFILKDPNSAEEYKRLNGHRIWEFTLDSFRYKPTVVDLENGDVFQEEPFDLSGQERILRGPAPIPADAWVIGDFSEAQLRTLSQDLGRWRR